MLALHVLIIRTDLVSLDQLWVLIIVLAGRGGALLALLDENALTSVDAIYFMATFIILSNFCKSSAITIVLILHVMLVLSIKFYCFV